METETIVNVDTNKIDEAALALLFLTLSSDKYGARVWKGIDWDVLNRLHEKAYIFDPKNTAKSVSVTESGEKKMEAMFKKHFSLDNSTV